MNFFYGQNSMTILIHNSSRTILEFPIPMSTQRPVFESFSSPEPQNKKFPNHGVELHEIDQRERLVSFLFFSPFCFCFSFSTLHPALFFLTIDRHSPPPISDFASDFMVQPYGGVRDSPSKVRSPPIAKAHSESDSAVASYVSVFQLVQLG